MFPIRMTDVSRNLVTLHRSLKVASESSEGKFLEEALGRPKIACIMLCIVFGVHCWAGRKADSRLE